jgi:trehalose 6-phosphate synthase/phosphatase
VVILSGRDKGTLENWFSSIKINLVAEHGIYFDRLAGSFIEEKEFSIAWHYRQFDPF